FIFLNLEKDSAEERAAIFDVINSHFHNQFPHYLPAIHSSLQQIDPGIVTAQIDRGIIKFDWQFFSIEIIHAKVFDLRFRFDMNNSVGWIWIDFKIREIEFFYRSEKTGVGA